LSAKIIETIVSAPAVTLEKSIQASEFVAKTLSQKTGLKKAGQYWDNLGPGLTTGAADDDPSGIATYSQTGSQYGFKFLWLAVFTFPFMAIVQEMCARIGIVTGRGLAGNIKLHFSKKVLYTCAALLFIANTFNIGADLGAMAAASRLLLPSFGYSGLVFFFALISLFLQIFSSYATYAKYLKWLTLILFSYIFAALSIQTNFFEIVKYTFIPHFSFTKDAVFLVCGILGTTISPYLFFWQSSQEVEEDILSGKTSLKQRVAITSAKDIKKMRVDVWTGMFFSNLVMFFIILTCGSVLYKSGITNVQTAADAALALKPLAGPYASLLFTLGIVGTGLLAVPVLAGSAAYAVAESFGWKQGLYKKLKQAYAFYGIIIISMGLGILLNFIGLDPIKALIYSAVLNGLVAPIVLILIVTISSNKKIMGQWVNSKKIESLGWIVTALMILVGTATIAAIIVP
jgi:NRAMP (natural resistance-associated macrophage protein)-like metal ion transporter